MYSVTLHHFRISSHLSSCILGFDNNRYPRSTLPPLFKCLRTLLFPNMWLNDSQLSFKNRATVLTLFFHFTLLHMKNQERVTTPSTSTNCQTHLPCHLASQFTPPLEHSWCPSLLPAKCVTDMVTHLFNVFGMALAFALTAKKWGIQYIIAAFYVETNSVSALTCCTA